ncbi:response regulator transcription factor [Parasutterella secunda]|uniref:response regulator transcription factor n=1 Tax=Parasutterella secunda TaxID=626947 RepID=UPI0025A4C2ED|nr:response regulator transcription factor [Parasutterella secunda]MDM8087685.1 response regulator transcription factor [Parasutterella secunda]
MSLAVLLVDDNTDILCNVRDYLEMNGMAVETAINGKEALERLSQRSYAVCVLDIGLPDVDGLTVCKTLRANGDKTPILMLTARDSIDDRVTGLEVGADDYLIKPFSLRELNARVQALVRRAYGDSEMKLRVGDLTFDLSTTQVNRAGKPIKLNPTCLTILKELMIRSPAIVSRSRLEAQVWGGGAPDSDSLRANIYLLRQAIDKAFDKKLIHTHPGLGWSINE